MLLVQGRGEFAVLSAVTEILFSHTTMDTCTNGNIFSRGLMRKWRFFLEFLHFCYITVLWIYGLQAMLLVQGSGLNFDSSCSYCSTLTLQCYGYVY